MGTTAYGDIEEWRKANYNIDYNIYKSNKQIPNIRDLLILINAATHQL